MKTYNEMLSEVARAVSPSDKEFIGLHKIKKTSFLNTPEHQFKGGTKKDKSKLAEPSDDTGVETEVKKERPVGESVEGLDERDASVGSPEWHHNEFVKHKGAAQEHSQKAKEAGEALDKLPEPKRSLLTHKPILSPEHSQALATYNHHSRKADEAREAMSSHSRGFQVYRHQMSESDAPGDEEEINECITSAGFRKLPEVDHKKQEGYPIHYATMSTKHMKNMGIEPDATEGADYAGPSHFEHTESKQQFVAYQREYDHEHKVHHVSIRPLLTKGATSKPDYNKWVHGARVEHLAKSLSNVNHLGKKKI